jgi:hypothetical protein
MKQKGVPLGAALVATLLLLVHSLTAQTPTSRTEESAVRTFLAEFISAFDNLEWDKFRNSFTDDATVFYPRGAANRADGRAQYEAHFRLVFEQIRAGRTSGPYMDLQPRDLRVEIIGGYRDVSAGRPPGVRQSPHPGFEKGRRSVEDRALACLRGCRIAARWYEVRVLHIFWYSFLWQ